MNTASLCIDYVLVRSPHDSHKRAMPFNCKRKQCPNIINEYLANADVGKVESKQDFQAVLKETHLLLLLCKPDSSCAQCTLLQHTSASGNKYTRHHVLSAFGTKYYTLMLD